MTLTKDQVMSVVFLGGIVGMIALIVYQYFN
jgi:hypothetical protein